MNTTTPNTTKTITTTGAKRAPRVSPEERREQAAALHESITVQVEALRDTEQWRRFLGFASSFHRYSLSNLLLILAQRSDATAVAGFRAWQARGRQVRKGEKAIRIFGFAQRKLTAEDQPDDDATTGTDEAGERVQRYFPMVSVFAIEQTDLIDGFEDPRAISRPLTGTDDHGVTSALTAALEADGWTVERRQLPAGTNGFAQPDTRTVVLSETLTAAGAAKTLIHETAHILMGHVEDLDAYALHRGLMETAAESVAYVVAGLAGFDTAAYSVGYVAGWSGCDTTVIRSTAARVLATAHRIAELLDTDNEAEQGDS